MKIIIDIPGEIRKAIFDGVYCGIADKRVFDAIKNGISLPEEYGRLFDEKDIVSGNYEIKGNKIYGIDPIIEAKNEE